MILKLRGGDWYAVWLWLVQNSAAETAWELQSCLGERFANDPHYQDLHIFHLYGADDAVQVLHAINECDLMPHVTWTGPTTQPRTEVPDVPSTPDLPRRTTVSPSALDGSPRFPRPRSLEV